MYHTHGHGACGMLTLDSRLSLHVLPRAVGAPRHRPTTTEATWPSAAFATETANSTAQTPRSILPDAMVLLASLCVRRLALRHGF